MSQPSSSQAARGSTLRNKKWINTNDVALLHIMLEMRKEGKVLPRGFTSKGWALITKEMQTKFEPEFNKDKLKNRLKSYKKWYSAMKVMLNLSGFGWYEERKKVTAEAGVWDDYIAAHPGASMYRSRSMPDYYILCEIFGDSIADGRDELVANDITQSPPSIHNDALDENDMNDDDDATPNTEEVGDEHISTNRGRSAAPGGSSRQRCQSAGDSMVVVVQNMADAIHIMARNTSEERMKKVWEAILPHDLELVMKLRAFQQLENEEKASQFLPLDNEYRKLFILNFLNN
ncbi:hypothetical protein AAC387_Pa05g1154 [Persea americana]